MNTPDDAIPNPDITTLETPAPVDPTPPAAPVAATPAETLYDVKYGGQVQKVPLSELTAGYQRHLDYTQKTMSLSEQRKAYETEREELRTFLQDPANVQKLYEHLTKGAADPQQALTLASAKETFQPYLDSRIEAATQELQLSHRREQYRADIDTTVKGAIEKYPELKTVRRIDEVIRREVAALQPETIEDTRRAILAVAQEQATQLRNYWTEESKRAAVAKPAVGIEPPGGAAPLAVPAKTYKLGSPELRADAVRALEAAINEGK